MKKDIILIYALAMLIGGMLTSCGKFVDRVNSNTITVTFAASGPKFVTTDLTLNPKDSIQFNYAVSCPTRMKYVFLQKNGTNVAADTLKLSSFNFTAIKKLIADSAAGPFIYAVVARDSLGYYLGTSQSFTLTTTPDFTYYVNRTLFVPDTTAKTNACYFASTNGKTYSYTSAGATNSALIDFGYYYNPDSAQTAGVKKTPFGHFIYALNVSPVPNPISFYDISTWTKNATIFKIASTPVYTSVLSGGGIKAGCLTNLKTGATSSVPVVTTTITGGKQTDVSTPLASGNLIWFKTAAGKYGVIQIDYINQNSAAHGTFMTVDIKIQK